MRDNNLYQKSYAFAVLVVKTYQVLKNDKKEFILSKQFLRSGTSIGANVAEANGAISKADFSAKISIAYKESLETKYWLNLLRDTDYLSVDSANILLQHVDELGKILFSILRTTRINAPTNSKN